MYIPHFPLLIFNLSTGEIVIIAIIILLFFGGRKIPELMKGLGKGVKTFKQGMNEIENEINTPIEDNKTKEQKTDKSDKSEK